MTFLRSWLLSVTACAVLVSIVQQLTDGGTMKKIVRFVGGMVLMLAMLRPLLSLTFDLPELDGGHYREAVEALKETLNAEQDSALGDSIAAQTQAYIEDKASSLGLSVRAEVKDGEIIVDVYLMVRYGYVIPETARKVQDSVSAAVSGMTGYNVHAVNVHVGGISFN